MTRLVLAILAVLLVAVSPVSGHVVEYVNVTGDQQVVCAPAPLRLSQGGFCFPPGHVAPDESGRAVIEIVDDLLDPVSGAYCQDLTGDFFCDTPPRSFCGSMVLQVGQNWDPQGSIDVYVDGPVFGQPGLSVCRALSAGVHGFGMHS